MRNEIPNVFLIIVKAAIFVHVFLFLKFNWKSFPYNKVICVQYAFCRAELLDKEWSVPLSLLDLWNSLSVGCASAPGSPIFVRSLKEEA